MGWSGVRIVWSGGWWCEDCVEWRVGVVGD